MNGDYDTSGRDEGIVVAARERSRDVASRAREEALRAARQQKGNIVNELSALSSAMKKAARTLEGDDQKMVGQLLAGAAMGIEMLAKNVGEREIEQIRSSVEQFVRQHPAIVAGGAFALGFAGARILKATAVEQAGDSRVDRADASFITQADEF